MIEQPDLPFRLTGSQAKTAFALRQNAETLIRDAGLAAVGFLTLTVGDQTAEGFRQVFDAAEASRRINNLNRRVLPLLFSRAIVVTERHKSGAIHFHVLGALASGADIRTGFDFDAVARGEYSSSCPALREMWAFMRDVLPKYGFGRAELTPIRKTGEAIASYVSKYVEKNLFNRLAADRRKKLVRYVGWQKHHLKPNEFSWGTQRAAAWRCKARKLASLIMVYERETLREVFGSRWAFKMTEVIRAVNDEPKTSFDWIWPEQEAARRLMYRYAGPKWTRHCRAEERATQVSAQILAFRGCKTTEFDLWTTQSASR